MAVDMDDLEEALTNCVRYHDPATLWELLKRFPLTLSLPNGRIIYDPKEQKWTQVIS